jgi:hypothetical protein
MDSVPMRTPLWSGVSMLQLGKDLIVANRLNEVLRKAAV